MKKTKGRKKAGKLLKKAVRGVKKASKRAKKKVGNVKSKTRRLLNTAKKKAYATEEEIMDYVKENPIKSISAVALTGLIAGFLTYRYKK